jgi:hypothetical protein
MAPAPGITSTGTRLSAVPAAVVPDRVGVEQVDVRAEDLGS